MAVAGPAFFGTVVDSNAVGTDPWVNVNNVKADDGSVCTLTLPDGHASHYLKFTNPQGLSFPANSVIDYIILQIKRFASQQDDTAGQEESIRDSDVQLIQGGVIGGTVYAYTAEDWPVLTAIQTYVIQNNTGGRSWTVADFTTGKSGMGGVLSILAQDKLGLSITASVDYVSICVGYHLQQIISPTFRKCGPLLTF